MGALLGMSLSLYSKKPQATQTLCVCAWRKTEEEGGEREENDEQCLKFRLRARPGT